MIKTAYLLYFLFLLIGIGFALLGICIVKLIRKIGEKHERAYTEYLKAIAGGSYAGLLILVLTALFDVYKKYGFSLESFVSTGIGIFLVCLVVALGAIFYIKMSKSKPELPLKKQPKKTTIRDLGLRSNKITEESIDTTIKKKELTLLKVSICGTITLSILTLVLVGTTLYSTRDTRNQTMATLEMVNYQIDYYKPQFSINADLVEITNLPEGTIYAGVDFLNQPIYFIFTFYGVLYNTSIRIDAMNSGFVPITVYNIKVIDDCMGKHSDITTNVPSAVLKSGEKESFYYNFKINGSFINQRKYCNVVTRTYTDKGIRDFNILFVRSGEKEIRGTINETCFIECSQNVLERFVWENAVPRVLPNIN